MLECFFCHVLPPPSSCRTRILSKSRVRPMALKISRLSYTYLFLCIRESLLTLVLSTLQCRFPSGGGFPQLSFLGAPSSAAVKIPLPIIPRGREGRPLAPDGTLSFSDKLVLTRGGMRGTRSISLEFEFLIFFCRFFWLFILQGCPYIIRNFKIKSLSTLSDPGIR